MSKIGPKNKPEHQPSRGIQTFDKDKHTGGCQTGRAGVHNGRAGLGQALRFFYFLIGKRPQTQTRRAECVCAVTTAVTGPKVPAGLHQ